VGVSLGVALGAGVALGSVLGMALGVALGVCVAVGLGGGAGSVSSVIGPPPRPEEFSSITQNAYRPPGASPVNVYENVVTGSRTWMSRLGSRGPGGPYGSRYALATNSVIGAQARSGYMFRLVQDIRTLVGPAIAVSTVRGPPVTAPVAPG
jgi:hypothetical protein